MHTLSTRTLSALAFDRGEEYDPAMAVAPDLIETLSLIEQARPMIGEDGPYEPILDGDAGAGTHAEAPPASSCHSSPSLVGVAGGVLPLSRL
jgi:hypothetical protein